MYTEPLEEHLVKFLYSLQLFSHISKDRRAATHDSIGRRRFLHSGVCNQIHTLKQTLP